MGLKKLGFDGLGVFPQALKKNRKKSVFSV
jgi:hypothetical protein